ncbi:MAG: biotin--[acetyl-CoA-carboxylase] ligase [Crocinitomicaceae bacterium]
MKLRHFNETFFRVNQTHSTNSLLWEILENKPYENGTSVIAHKQTKGKGQKGNIWITEPGKNITFSLLLFPELESKNVFYLNIMASLAIQRTLHDLDITSEIKWPNDILVNECKIAGLLIENQIQGRKINKSVVGIGLNVNQSHFPFIRPVTSISKELGTHIDLENIFTQLYQNLDFFFNLLITKDLSLLKKLYLQNLYRYEKWAEYSTEKHGKCTGQIVGIDDDGKVVVQFLDKSEVHFDMQTIQFV